MSDLCFCDHSITSHQGSEGGAGHGDLAAINVSWRRSESSFTSHQVGHFNLHLNLSSKRKKRLHCKPAELRDAIGVQMFSGLVPSKHFCKSENVIMGCTTLIFFFNGGMFCILHCLLVNVL